MKSRWSLLYVAIATTLLLTACGTSPNEDKEGTNGSYRCYRRCRTKGTVSEGEEPGTEVAESQENILKDAELTESDEQGYAISVLPDYN